jgi:hypothetical protein
MNYTRMTHIENIRNIYGELGIITLTHVYREVNQVVYGLTKYGLSLTLILKVFCWQMSILLFF